jgi:hypothetical protein
LILETDYPSSISSSESSVHSDEEVDYSDLDKNENQIRSGGHAKPKAGTSTTQEVSTKMTSQLNCEERPAVFSWPGYIPGPEAILTARARFGDNRRLVTRYHIRPPIPPADALEPPPVNTPAFAPTLGAFQALLETFGKSALQLQADHTLDTAAPDQEAFVQAFQGAVRFVNSMIEDRSVLNDRIQDLAKEIKAANAINVKLSEQVKSALAEDSRKDKDIKSKEEETKVLRTLYLNAIQEKEDAEAQRSRDAQIAADAVSKRRREVFDEAMKKAKVSGQ